MADDKSTFLIDFALKNGPAAVGAITSMRVGAFKLVDTLTSLKTIASTVFAGYAITKAAQFGKELASIQSHARRTETVFGRFGDAGVKALDDIRKFADKSGIGLEHAEELGTKLLTTFGARASANLTKLLADTQAANALTAQSFDQLGDKVLEFGSKSKLGVGDIEGFSKVSGYSIKELKEQVSRDTSISTKAIGNLIEKGKLLAPVLLGAVNKLNKARLGTDKMGLGAIEDASKDAEKQLQRLSDVWLNVQRQLAKEIFTEDNVKSLSEFITKIPGYVDDAKMAFSEFGAGFKQGFKPALDGFSKAAGAGKDFSSIDWGKVGSDVGKVASAITTIANKVAAIVSSSGDEASDERKANVKGFTAAGAGVGTVFGAPGMAVGGAAGYGLAKVENFAIDAYDFITGNKHKKQAAQLGKDVVNGYVNGVKKSAKKAAAANKDMATTSIEATKRELDSHSPSKVFEKIGSDVVQGYVDGISGEGPMLDMVAQRVLSLSDFKDKIGKPVSLAENGGTISTTLGQLAALNGSPKHAGSSIGDVNVVVNVNGTNASADDIGSKVGAAVRNELERMMNRALLAGG